MFFKRISHIGGFAIPVAQKSVMVESLLGTEIQGYPAEDKYLS